MTYRCNYLNGKLFNWNTSIFHLCIKETLFEWFLKQKTILEDCWIFSRDSVTWYSLRNLKRSSGSLTTAVFFLLIHMLKNSKKNYAKKWRIFFVCLWCHTITDGTNLRRSPLLKQQLLLVDWQFSFWYWNWGGPVKKTTLYKKKIQNPPQLVCSLHSLHCPHSPWGQYACH